MNTNVRVGIGVYIIKDGKVLLGKRHNDPEKAGKVKVWVPHVSPTVYTKWNELNKDKSFKFIGKNIDSDITDVVEDLKRILPWAICAAPLNGSSGSGRYCFDLLIVGKHFNSSIFS